jgi:GT2 family glycosyltransferase
MLRVLIVAYRNGLELQNLLDSLVRQLKLPFEVVVWDNGASRQVVEEWKGHHTTHARLVGVYGDGSNLGFAAAVNRAARLETSHEAWTDLLLINPDAQLASSFGQAELERLRALRGLVGLRVFDDAMKSRRQANARMFPSLLTSIAGREGLLTRLWPDNPWSRRYLGAELDLQSDAHAVRVDWVSGCALFVRREEWEKLEGYDTRYFLYVEDVDLGRKARLINLPVYYAPWVDVVHAIRGSARHRAFFSDLQHHRGMLKYHWKWAGPVGRLLSPLIWAGVWIRFAVRRSLAFFCSARTQLETPKREKGAP